MYLISKNCNTSYTDVYDITPSERTFLFSLISKEIETQSQVIENIKIEREKILKKRK